MAEYIEREAALEPLKRWNLDLTLQYGARDEYVTCLDEVIEKLKAIPAADVRPVIFCRDCIHCFHGKESLECEKHRYAWNDARRWVNEDDYCCWGVSKQEVEHD